MATRPVTFQGLSQQARDMDQQLGKDFETGLANLQVLAEAEHAEEEEEDMLDNAVRKAMAETEPNPGYRPGKFPPPAPQQ